MYDYLIECASFISTHSLLPHTVCISVDIDTQVYVHTFVLLFSLLSLIFSFLAFTPTMVSHYQCTMTGKKCELVTHFINKRPFADYLPF